MELALLGPNHCLVPQSTVQFLLRSVGVIAGPVVDLVWLARRAWGRAVASFAAWVCEEEQRAQPQRRPRSLPASA